MTFYEIKYIAKNYIMKNYYQFHNRNKNKTTPLTYKKDIFTLIYEGNLTTTLKAIKNGDISLYHRNDKGQTLLHWAILYNQIEIAQELIALGASLDVSDNKGNTVREIINIHFSKKDIENLLFLDSKKITSIEEDIVVHEQPENQELDLLGCIKNNCVIF